MTWEPPEVKKGAATGWEPPEVKKSAEIPVVTLDQSVVESNDPLPALPAGGTGAVEQPKPLEARMKRGLAEKFMTMPQADTKSNREIFYQTLAKKSGLNINEVRSYGEKIASLKQPYNQVKTLYDQQPDDPQAILQMSLLMDQMEDEEQAKTGYSKIISMEDVDPQTYGTALQKLSMLERKAGNDEAAAVYEHMMHQALPEVGSQADAMQPGNEMTFLGDDPNQMVATGSDTKQSRYLSGIADAIERNVPGAGAEKMIGAGIEKTLNSKEVTKKEGVASGVLNAAVGIGEALLGAANATPAGAMFMMPFEQAQNNLPEEVTKWMAPARTILTDYYNQFNLPLPAWVNNTAAIIDFGLLAATAHGITDLTKIKDLPAAEKESIIKEVEQRAQGKQPEEYAAQVQDEVVNLVEQGKELQEQNVATESVNNPIAKTPEPPATLSDVKPESDISYKGEPAKIDRTDTGEWYVINGEGKRTFLKTEKVEGKEPTLEELGVQVIPDIPQETIMRVTAANDNTGSVQYKDNTYFVSSGKEGDIVGVLMPDGTVKDPFTHHKDGKFAEERKLAIVNAYLEGKGLPKKTSLNEIKETIEEEIPSRAQEPVSEEPVAAMPEVTDQSDGSPAANIPQEQLRVSDRNPDAPVSELTKTEEIIPETPETITEIPATNEKINEIRQEEAQVLNEDVSTPLMPEEAPAPVSAETPSDFVPEQGKKSLLNRGYEGVSAEDVKASIERHGLTYEIESHPVAEQKAQSFIDEVGVEAALDAVRESKIEDGVAAFVWSKLIDQVGMKMSEAKTPEEVKELTDLETQLISEFDKKARSGGRFISALQEVYKTSDFEYKLSNQIEKYKEANGGVIPEEVEAKFKEYDKQIQELNKKITELEAAPPEIIIEQPREKKIRQSLSKEKAERKSELAAKYRGQFNDISRITTLLGEKDFREYATLILEEAAGDFRIWSRELINNAGEKIAEHLPKLYEEIYGKTKEEQAKIKRLEKQIEDLQKGKITTKEKRVDSDEVKALKEELRQKKEEMGLFAAKELPKPNMTEVEKQTNGLQKQIEDYKAKTEEIKSTGTIPEKPFKPVIKESAIIKLKAEKLRVKSEYDKEIYKAQIKNRTTRQKAIDTAWNAWGLTRLLSATGEFSFMGIQGLVQSIAHPTYAKKAFSNALDFMKSEKRTEEWLSELKSQEFWPELKQFKLAITEPHAQITAREELFVNDWANAVWNAVGSPLKLKSDAAYEKWKTANPMKALERASVGYLDTIRVMRWLDGKQMLEQRGIDAQSNPQAYKEMADVINTLTGRASLGKAETIAEPLTKLFFSPRNWASMIKQATPYAFYHFGKMRAGAEGFKPSVAQKMALADFSKFAGLTTSLVALAAVALNNDDDPETGVEMDATSSDYGKIKIGKTRIDPWGGRIQQVTALSRLINDSVKKESGEVVPLGTPFKTPTREGVLIDMATNKLAPSAAIIERYLASRVNKEGERVDKFGQPYKFSKEVTDRLYPIYWGTVKDLAKDGINPLEGILAFYAFFGGGVNVYEGATPQSPKQLMESLKSGLPDKPKPPKP